MKINLAITTLFIPALLAMSSAHAAVAPAVQSAQAALQIEVEAPQTTGQIAIAIYRDADSFRRSAEPVRTLKLDRRGAVTSASVTGLPPGRYVIAAFQDTNGDGKLSLNPVGIPREPFGFSNNARARFGLPSFDSAAFSLTASGATQRMVLRGLF